MFGIGTQEIVIIVFLLLFVVLPIFLATKLKKRYPNRLWIGILLCLLNGGLAQFYLPGGLKYFLILAVIFVILKTVMGSANAFLVTDVLAILFIWYRHYKIKQSPLSEVKLQGS